MPDAASDLFAVYVSPHASGSYSSWYPFKAYVSPHCPSRAHITVEHLFRSCAGTGVTPLPAGAGDERSSFTASAAN